MKQCLTLTINSFEKLVCTSTVPPPAYTRATSWQTLWPYNFLLAQTQQKHWIKKKHTLYPHKRKYTMRPATCRRFCAQLPRLLMTICDLWYAFPRSTFNLTCSQTTISWIYKHSCIGLSLEIDYSIIMHYYHYTSFFIYCIHMIMMFLPPWMQ